MFRRPRSNDPRIAGYILALAVLTGCASMSVCCITLVRAGSPGPFFGWIGIVSLIMCGGFLIGTTIVDRIERQEPPRTYRHWGVHSGYIYEPKDIPYWFDDLDDDD